MTSKFRVPIFQTPLKSCVVEHESTKGATLGVNVYRADGSVVSEADIAPVVAPSGSATPAPTMWSLIQNIPANIAALVSLATDGWIRRDGAAITARELAASDSSYDNTTSGLVATDVQAAVDEVAARSVTGSWTTVKKTSNQTRTSTTTYADDGALTFAVVSGTTYAVRARIFYTSAAEALKHRPNCSAATTNVFSHLRQSGPGAIFGTDNEFTGAQSGFWFANTATGSGPGFVEFDAVFTASANGTFAWQWAQNVSGATNLTVLKGSYLEYATI